MSKPKYAYSIKTIRVREPDFPYDGKELTGTKDLVNFARSLYDSDNEKMLCIYLDGQNKVLSIQVITGIANQCVIYPRQVLRPALLINASAIILIHNHPSGCLRPSDADIRLTNVLKEQSKALDLVLHDHVILGEHGKFLSLREEGIV